MEIYSRPAVRIICLDARARILLLRWQDPSDGSHLWEPPGGGIEPGETPFAAAQRELVEETGLDPSSIVDYEVIVARDTVWNGRRWVGPESFFLAHYPTLDGPDLSRAGLLPDEVENLRGHAWLSRDQVTWLTERLEPPSLLDEIARLTPDWMVR